MNDVFHPAAEAEFWNQSVTTNRRFQDWVVPL